MAKDEYIFVENPVVNHRGNLALWRERDLALDGDPDMGMRASRRHGRKPERDADDAAPIPLSPAHSDASLLAKCGDEMARRLNYGSADLNAASFSNS